MTCAHGRVGRDSALARNRSVRCSFKPPRTRSVRIQGLRPSKKVRAKVSISPQIERGERGINAVELGELMKVYGIPVLEKMAENTDFA